MRRVWGPSSNVTFRYTSWLYKIVELESGDRVNVPTSSPLMEKEMFTNVVVLTIVFGRILYTYTADPLKCTVTVAGVSGGVWVASCQVCS